MQQHPSHDLVEKARRSFESGNWDIAVAAWFELTQRQPEAIAPHFMLGASLHQQGRHEDALLAFRRVLELDPTQLQAHLAIATLLSDLGRHEAALIHCQRAIALSPSDPSTHTNAGIVYEALARPEHALAAYDQALACDPTWQDALNNRGILLLSLGKFQKSLDNNRHFVASYPKQAAAHFNFGESCLATHNYSAATQAFAAVRHLSPHDTRALMHQGFSLALQERFAEAQALLETAWQEDRNLASRYKKRIFLNSIQDEIALDARTLFILYHYERIECCDWTDLEQFRSTFAKILAETNPPLDRALAFRAMAVGIDPQLQFHLARTIASADPKQAVFPPLMAVTPHCRALRIGYLSPDFREHPVGILACKLFALHDRQKFLVFAYAIGPAGEGAIRHEIATGSDSFCDLANLSDTQAANQIRADKIDILIDMAGYTEYGRPGILKCRPAPLQVAWLGYPATSGADWMDYIVLDPATAPPHMDDCCSEAIIRLPHSLFFCSCANEQPPAVSRQKAGLPVTGPILAAFHNGFKIDPAVFSIWMRLLERSASAILWLLAGKPEMEANLKREAKSRGVAPERLIFAPRMTHQQHLARFAHADLLLDTPQCSGGSTVCDALVAGVPVLTCSGSGIAQNMATSLVLAAGFAKGVTDNITNYELRAHEWLSSPSRLPLLREELRTARATAPFFQLNDWVAYFESALDTAWQRHAQGLPPQTFAVTP